MVVADSGGERGGEDEEAAAKLTVHPIWAKEVLEREVDGGAKLDVSGNGDRRSAGPIPAEFGRGRARKEVEEVRDEAREVLARGIEAG